MEAGAVADANDETLSDAADVIWNLLSSRRRVTLKGIVYRCARDGAAADCPAAGATGQSDPGVTEDSWSEPKHVAEENPRAGYRGRSWNAVT